MYVLAIRGAVSRPSVNAWRIGLIPRSSHSFKIPYTWSSELCTPPSETRPIRWSAPPARFAAANSSCTARLPASSPAWIAFEIRTMSMSITRPAPSVVWPTSELPIWPSGRPTAAPDVSICACG